VASPRPRAVLVVEDEGLVAQDLQQCLRDLGYDAFAVAASAEEAMARAAERPPDIALVDIRIKGRLDGIKTAQLLQERFRVPIVYMTGNADDTTLQRALQTRPQGFLVKPIRTAELQSAIEIALHASDRGNGNGGSDAAPGPAAARPARAPSAAAVRAQLARIFASADFDAPRRSREFLRFVADEVIAGRGDDLTQVAIAVEVFGRKSDFDAIVDPIVRIQAGRLRRSLERYYLLSGKGDPVRIELPKGTYAPAFRTAVKAEEAPVVTAPPPVARDPWNGWPAVVLTTFEAPGGSAPADDLATEVTEELARELGRHRVVRVLPQRDRDGRPSSAADHARFVLGGRLRAEGEGLRVSAHLFDRTTGEQVWGDDYHTSPRPGRWSGTPDDVARVVAGRVGSEEGVVIQVLARERRGADAASPTSYDAILRSYDFVLTGDPAAFGPAVSALRRLVEVEPESGPAWTRLGRLLLADYALEVTASPAPLDEAIRCAQRGVRTDPTSRGARCVLAAALLVKGELAGAREEVEEALRTGPDSLVCLEMIGFLLTMLGDWERGPALSRSARQRNPHCLPYVQVGLWADHVRRGELSAAYQSAREYGDPTFFWRGVMRASCLGLLGRLPEATAELAELLSARPDFAARGRVLIGHYLKFPEVMDRVVEGLGRAGLRLQ